MARSSVGNRTTNLHGQGDFVLIILEFLFSKSLADNESVGLGAKLPDPRLRDIDILERRN